MWRLLCVFLILCSSSLFAQRDTGLVSTKDTTMVIQLRQSPTILKYRPGQEFDTLRLFPKLNSFSLQEVNIYGARNYKLDSIKRRKEYAAIFAQKPLTLMDVFTKKSPEPTRQYAAFQSSTSSIVGISLLPLVGLLTKNRSATSKLQKKLLKEEETSYLDNRFSKQKITALTSMKGDSLESFINVYRPGREVLMNMTDYEMLVYIKKSHKEFEKTFKKDSLPALIKK
jgi:hypothetical protein